MSKSEETKDEKDMLPEVHEDCVALVRCARMYAITSKDQVVLGHKEAVDKAYTLVQGKKYRDAMSILNDIYAEELVGVRDREFKWCIRDGLTNIIDLVEVSEGVSLTQDDVDGKTTKSASKGTTKQPKGE